LDTAPRILAEAPSSCGYFTELGLKSLGSISTRREMRPLQERLARRYSTFCINWPGFGDQARPPVNWVPDTYSAFLSFLLTSMVVQPHAIIAAGHAAGYALKQAVSAPQTTPRLVLIAPTSRGPLPTILDGHRPFFALNLSVHVPRLTAPATEL